MTKIMKTGIVIFILALAGVYIYFLGSHQDERLIIYGNVDIRTVNVSFRVAGRLTSMNFDEGDSVRSGEIVAKLDSAPFINANNEAYAAIAIARAQLDLLLAGSREEEIAQARSTVNHQQEALNYAEKFYARQKQLWPSRVIAANDLENARTTRNQALASLEQSKQQLTLLLNGSRKQQIDQAKASLVQAQIRAEQTTLDLDDTVLKAPADGIILTRVIEPGTMLSAGDPVLNLSLVQPVWIRAYVNEINLSRAITGATVQIFTDARPDEPYTGKIGFVANTAEFTPKNVETPELRTDLVYRLRIIVTDPDDALRQGMPVTIHFPTSPQR